MTGPTPKARAQHLTLVASLTDIDAVAIPPIPGFPPPDIDALAGANGNFAWAAHVLDAADWQERHSPTEHVLVTFATAVGISPDGKSVKVTREQRLCRRRRDDARLFDSLSDKQQRAFEAIGHAFRAVTEGCGWKVRSLESIGRGVSFFTEHQLELRSRYRKWSDACRQEKLDIAMCLDIVAFGLSCRSVDAGRHVRKGTARGNLAACLDVWG